MGGFLFQACAGRIAGEEMKRAHTLGAATRCAVVRCRGGGDSGVLVVSQPAGHGATIWVAQSVAETGTEHEVRDKRCAFEDA